MSWPTLAGLAQRATLRAFGESVSYTPIGGELVSLVGIFSERYVDVDLNAVSGNIGNVSVASVGPAIDFKLADLPGGVAERGATLVIRGKAYTVANVEPDGHGAALLRLRAT